MCVTKYKCFPVDFDDLLKSAYKFDNFFFLKQYTNVVLFTIISPSIVYSAFSSYKISEVALQQTCLTRVKRMKTTFWLHLIYYYYFDWFRFIRHMRTRRKSIHISLDKLNRMRKYSAKKNCFQIYIIHTHNTT